MLDDLQESSSPQSQKDYWEIARRRRWWFLSPLFVVWVVTVALSYILPASYRSTALILAAQPASDVVSPNVKNDLTQRLRDLSQQTLSRPRLQRIIADLHLYSDKQTRLSPEQMAETMRHDIQIDPVPIEDIGAASSEDQETAARKALTTPTGKPPEAIGFRLTYSAPNAELAKHVANELASLFIEENRSARQQESEITTTFLQGQVENARDLLKQRQARIIDFKNRFLGELPEQKESNLQVLATLHSRLEAANSDLARAEEQELYLESLSGQYHSLQSSLDVGSSSAKSPADLDKQISRLREQLADLGSYYSANYPDVKRLQEQLAETEKMKDKALADEAKSNTQPSGRSDTPTVPRPSSYQELQAMTPMLEIESQVQSNKKQIQDDRQLILVVGKQIQMYEARMSRTPMRQDELDNFQKDYDQARSAYDSLVAKSNQSELATDMERRNQGEQFIVLNAPNLPKAPYNPDRFMWNLIGLGVGLVLGFLAAAGSEIFDKRIYSEKECKALVSVPILVEIPSVTTDTDEKREARRVKFEYALACSMLLVIGVQTFVSYVYFYTKS